MTFLRPSILLFAMLSLASALAQAPPEYAALQSAYDLLRANRFDDAIAHFRQALAISPEKASIYKDLGYALLKTGENLDARDAFAMAWSLDQQDIPIALEFAFLANETGQRRQARLVFLRFRDQNPTAAQAFTNIDQPLAEGIARWLAVVQQDPSNFSAHEELARLAEQRDQLTLAIDHFQAAWQLRPQRRELLVDLGRLLNETGQPERATNALLAASRATDSRIADRATRLLPNRYPYVYEFRNALAFDPTNRELRSELGYLLIAMGDPTSGQKELDLLAPTEPTLRDRSEAPSASVRTMGLRSYEAGFLPDAIRYLTAALDQDPLDFEVMLRLAWSYNLLKRDAEAVPWFELAAKSPDPAIAAEARSAWKRLTPEAQASQTSFWVFPTFSTRWHTAFGYAQWRTDLKLPFVKLRTYVSTRLVGDSRGAVLQPGFASPQYLSESSLIPAIGITSNTWRGLRFWGEAGIAWSYRHKTGVSRTQQDIRGGLSMVRSYGSLIGASSPGLFREHELDALYIHRFNRTFLISTRHRFGLTIPTDALRLQLTWNANFTADPRRQYWANFLETGPGLRFRFPFMPPSMLVTADALRGVYTTNRDNPRRPNFVDFRLGVWYSVSH
jgi:Tfp pilus assembly protein PilF